MGGEWGGRRKSGWMGRRVDGGWMDEREEER